MIEWISKQWEDFLVNPKPPGLTGKILFATAYTAQ